MGKRCMSAIPSPSSSRNSTAQAKRRGGEMVVDYDVLPAVVDTASAAKPGQPQMHEYAPGNTVFNWHLGDKASTDAAFAKAAHVTKLDLINNRTIPNAMEPRAALGEYDSKERTSRPSTPRARTLTSRVSSCPRFRESRRRTSCASSRPTSAAASAPRSSSTTRRRSASGRPRRSTGRSNGRRRGRSPS